MSIKIFLGFLVVAGMTVAGCATHESSSASQPMTAAAPLGPPGHPGKNLRQDYPPLDSYAVAPVGLGSVKVFHSIDAAGYSYRVYSLAKGKTHLGQVAPGTELAPPSLSEINYSKTQNLKVLFIDVAKIQSGPSPTPTGVSGDFPSFTDLTLLDKWGGTVDTITISSSATNEVTSALLQLCHRVK